MRTAGTSPASTSAFTPLGDVSYVDSWSAEQAFLERVLAFAQANGSGSVYALWRPDDGADLAKAPVMVFGDEGGVRVVMRDIRDLLLLLTLDTEISVDWERADFWREEEEEHSPGHDRYLAWLGRHARAAARRPRRRRRGGTRPARPGAGRLRPDVRALERTLPDLNRARDRTGLSTLDITDLRGVRTGTMQVAAVFWLP
jgi:hypothetical protein